METGVQLAPTSVVFSSSLSGAEDRFSTALFFLSTEGEGPVSTGFKVLVRLAALPLMTILPIAWIGETLKGGDLVPSSKLSSCDSLMTMGSLGTSFRAAGALEEVGALEGTDV